MKKQKRQQPNWDEMLKDIKITEGKNGEIKIETNKYVLGILQYEADKYKLNIEDYLIKIFRKEIQID